MKLTTLLLIISLFKIQANTYSQTTRITLDLESVQLMTVFEKIESLSEFKFLGNENVIGNFRLVSVKAKRKRINKILDELFNGTDIIYRIIDRQIVLVKIASSSKTVDEIIMSSPNEEKVQQNEITGSVVDSKGNPLPGASVVEKGTINGIQTDFDGNFTLTLKGGSATLVVSYIGFATKEIPVNGKTTLTITLVENAMGLDDVIVIGYGTQKKSDLTGSISSIKAEDIVAFPLARVDQALQGKASGVFVLNTDAAPGGNTLIRIRGNNSINGGNQPLIVIDGLQGGNLNTLNPSNIQSIEILKDASATAIYGSRGANGVILVTTKQGMTGKPKIQIGHSVGLQSLLRKLPVMSASEYVRFHNFVRSTNTADGNVPVPIFSDEQIAFYDANGGTDWQDELYGLGVINNLQLSVNGGTEKLKYLISTNYLDHKGILENSGYTRASLRSNFTAEINDHIEFGLNYNYTRSNATSPSFKYEVALVAQVVNTVPRWAPTEPVFNDDGTYFRHRPYGADGTWNPLASAREPIHDNPSTSNNFNLYLDFKLWDGLNLKVMGGGVLDNSVQNSFLNTKTRKGLTNNGFARSVRFGGESFQNSNILTFNKELNKHRFAFTGLFEQVWSKSESFGVEATDFVVEELGFNNLGGAKSSRVFSSASERSLLSYMGRINYSFNDRYLLTASYRADASSVFGNDNKWGYFPSASVAWRASQEQFIKDMVRGMDLKFRYSWGETGNQGIDPYQSLARLASSGGLQYPTDGLDNTNIGFGIGGLANPDLKWETTVQSNFGVDLSLFNGRFTTTFDYYKKTTEDLLMSRELPGYVGVSSILDNVGSVENKGIELAIGGDPFVGDFSWNTSFNFTSNRNKVLDLGEDERLTFSTQFGGYGVNDFMILEVGQPFGTMRGYVFEGIWGTDEAAEALRYGQLPGMPKYKDGNDDGVVDFEDKEIIGKGYPDYTVGWTNNFTYKDWGLSFLVLGSKGADLFNQGRIRREGVSEATDPRVLNYWTPENQNTDIPAILDGAYVQSLPPRENKYLLGGNETSRWVEDASFIRLKTVNLSYTFKESNQSWMKDVGIDNLNIYISGTNLITITDYTGYDPEVAAFPYSDAGVGVDLSVYPPQQVYTLGLNLSF